MDNTEILKKIDDQHESMIATLTQWATIHSGSESLKGLATMIDALQAAFSPLGDETERIPLPEAKRLNIHGKITATPLGEVLSVTKNASAPIQVLLVGHMDIALHAERPLERNPLRENNILHGRGTCDMKGGLVVLLTALRALETSSLSKEIGWRLLITPDEELGSPGSQSLLSATAPHYHLGLIFEPAMTDGALVSERKGSANYSIAVSGKAAHAGRTFAQGRNALTAAARFALAAEKLTDLEGEITVNIGHLEGGGLVNIVPDSAFCRLNVRAQDRKDLVTVSKDLEALAEAENNQEGISLALHQDSARSPKPFDKKTAALFEALRACAAQLGIPLQWRPSGGVCDGNTLAAAGLPTIDTLGVVGGNLHTAEEYMLLDSLPERAKLTTQFLMQIAAGNVTI